MRIEERFMRANYIGALEFREGFVFFRVVRSVVRHYRPYPLIDETGSPIAIPPSSPRPEVVLRDARNTRNKILHLPEPTGEGYPWMLHGSIGFKPQQVRVYPIFPAGTGTVGNFPELDPIRPTDGDPVGYVSSLESPYDHPTDYYEYVIVPGVDIGFAFYNEDPYLVITPELNIYFRLYYMQLLDPDADRDLVRAIARRQVPATYLIAGVDKPVEIENTMAKEWRLRTGRPVEPVSLDRAMEV